jgi:FixJ family two-component response regulator
MKTRDLVSVVDDDESVRESLPEFLKSFGLDSQGFSSAEAFLASESLDRTGCLVLDVAMPGMTGPELQEELARRSCNIPIVFITAHSDESYSPEALRLGAVAYLIKPFSEAAIIAAVNVALARA